MTSRLETIIDSLSKEEVRFFKLFLNRTVSASRKDVNLFDFLSDRDQRLHYKTEPYNLQYLLDQ